MENKKSTTRFLIIYCIAIFAFAVALILIASLSQMRINREADEIRDRLTNAEILAADKQTRLDAVMTENSRLNAQIKALEEEKGTLTTENEALKLRATAYQKLSEIINLRRMGKRSALATAKKAFDEGGFTAYLDEADLQVYNSIK